MPLFSMLERQANALGYMREVSGGKRSSVQADSTRPNTPGAICSAITYTTAPFNGHVSSPGPPSHPW